MNKDRATGSVKQPAVEIRKNVRRHPAFGVMKGMVTIAPGVDLTEPAMPEWAEMIEEKYGKRLK